MDVAVVGAGPAGAWAAYQLASAGARVTIFDALAPAGKAVRRRRHRTRAVTRTRGPGRGARPRDEHTHGAFHEGRRGAFRNRATQRRRARGHGPQRVRPARCSTRPSVRAPRSVASRVVDVTADPSIAVRTRNATYSADFLDRRRRREQSRPSKTRQAFHARATVDRDRLLRAWRHERRDRHRDGWRSAGISLVVSSRRPSRHRIMRPMRTLGAGVDDAATVGDAVDARSALDAPACRLDWYSWPIPSLDSHDFVTQDIAGTRWCLVGDAAGLVDPITREGIYFASPPARWAASCRPGRAERRARVCESGARRSVRRTRDRCAAQARIFPSRVHGSASRRARAKRTDSGRDGGPGRRDTELSDAEVAAADHVRDWRSRAHAERAWSLVRLE